MIFFNTLIDSFINLASVLGIFVIFGFIFNVIENKNNKIIQQALGEKVVIFTGFIGTVVHEISHMIMALIFNHKIVKVELFRPRKYKEDGVLGFVRSTYNPNSIYQQVGNFFIGIAPMIFGTLTIWILLILFSNNNYTMFIKNMNIGLYTNYLQSSNYLDFFKLLADDTFLLLKTIFSFDYIFSINHLIMLFLIYSISTHMALSLADLKGSFKGLSVCFIVVFAITLLGKILKFSNIFASNVIFKINLYIFLFLMLGLVFSLLTLFISFIINIVKK